MVCGNIFKTLSIPNQKRQGAEILRECSSHTMYFFKNPAYENADGSTKFLFPLAPKKGPIAIFFCFRAKQNKKKTPLIWHTSPFLGRTRSTQKCELGPREIIAWEGDNITQQTTSDGHCNHQTESAQWADSVKKVLFCRFFGGHTNNLPYF